MVRLSTTTAGQLESGVLSSVLCVRTIVVYGTKLLGRELDILLRAKGGF